MDLKRKAERAEFNRQMRARIQLLAGERGLPEAETKAVLSRLKHYEVVKFCQRHRVSYDWLIDGDLKGLLRMANSVNRRRPHEAPAPIDEEAQPAAAGQPCQAIVNPSRLDSGQSRRVIPRGRNAYSRR